MAMDPNTTSTADGRDLLVALNVGLPGRIQTAYRLAAAIEVWAELRSETLRRQELEDLAQRLQVPQPSLLEAIALLPRVRAIAEKERAGCRKVGARIVTLLDNDYPRSLLDLELPPPALYVAGDLADAPAVSIVGSRRSDPYGLEVSELFSAELAQAGMTIVSGLALGVDAAAHRGALDRHGRTFAVLGCGIDILYPRAHRRLAETIRSSGALVTEFPLGSAPEAWHFPIRNRIIAALSVATVVVRATPRSGSLITARHALELARNVYAVPGDIFDRRSVGPNCLIRDGAHPVQHPREILESLPCTCLDRLQPSSISSRPIEEDLEPRLAVILDLLPPGGSISEEKIVRASPETLGATLAALTELEISGWVQRHPGPTFVRARSPRL